MEKEFYLTLNKKDDIIDIQNIVGKIEFINTFESDILLESIKNGLNIIIKPYGYVENDENGDFKKFTLTGFAIENATC